MQNHDESKRQRSTKAQIQKYGKNRRNLWNEYAPVKVRVQYLCDTMFAGNYHEMALAAGICYRHMYRILYGHSRLTIRMAGQLVSRLGVRAEWLLCGSGSVFPCDHYAETFQYTPPINSCYYPADLSATVPGTYFLPPLPPDLVEPLDATALVRYDAAARSIFSARTNRKPVLFFLDTAAFSDTTVPLWREFFTRRYANLLMVTLAGACADLAAADEMPRPDINTLALTAAANKTSYGEAICTAGFNTEAGRQRSLMASVFGMGVPVFVSAAFGEIPNHMNPTARAPEFGAALGAASYVDLLSFAEQVQHFFGDVGGVIVACGDCRRAITSFLSRLRVTRDEFPQRNFVFVLFEEEDKFDRSLEFDIHQYGGRVIYLSKPTVTGIAQLLQSCDDAYAGKFTQTHDE